MRRSCRGAKRKKYDAILTAYMNLLLRENPLDPVCLSNIINYILLNPDFEENLIKWFTG